MKKYKNRVWLNCSYCNQRFWVYKSKFKKAYKNLFCSRECYSKFNRGENNPNWKGHTEVRKCKQCGKLFKFLADPGSVKKGYGKYCSKECGYKAKKGKGKLQIITEEKARKLFDEFKKSKKSVALFSKSKGYSETSYKLAKLFRKFFPDEYELVQEEKRARKDLWYKKGRSFEYRIKNYLNQKGFWVLRSPRSGSPIDLIAIKKNLILMIQCKAGEKRIRNKEKQKFLEICKTTGGMPILAYRPSFTKIAFKKVLEGSYEDYDL